MDARTKRGSPGSTAGAGRVGALSATAGGVRHRRRSRGAGRQHDRQGDREGGERRRRRSARPAGTAGGARARRAGGPGRSAPAARASALDLSGRGADRRPDPLAAGAGRCSGMGHRRGPRQLGRHARPRAVEPRGDGGLAHAERGAGLAVGETRRCPRPRAPRGTPRGAARWWRTTPRPRSRPRDPTRPGGSIGLGVIVQRHLGRPPPVRAQAAHMGVAQHPQQVAEIVVAAQPARLRQHERIGLLHEVLRILAPAAQRPRRPEQPVHVVAQPARVESMQRRRRSPHRSRGALYDRGRVPAPVGGVSTAMAVGRAGSGRRVTNQRTLGAPRTFPLR